MAHFSKFVRPGSVRSGSSAPGTLPNVAFEAEGGKTVLLVVNDGKSKQEFHVRYHGKWFKTELNEGAVGTYVWQASRERAWFMLGLGRSGENCL
jgi:glucosylceramidase